MTLTLSPGSRSVGWRGEDKADQSAPGVKSGRNAIDVVLVHLPPLGPSLLTTAVPTVFQAPGPAL